MHVKTVKFLQHLLFRWYIESTNNWGSTLMLHHYIFFYIFNSGLTPVKVRPGSATGCSSIEIDFVVHEFIIGDKLHPQNREIYRMLEEMNVY